MTSKVMALVASVAIATAPIGPALAQSINPVAEVSISDAWIAATPEEQQAARGGWVWAVFIVGARVSTLAIKYCGGNEAKVRACATGAQALFTSAKLAKQWTCNKYRRFC